MFVRSYSKHPSFGILPPALEETPNSQNLTPDISHTHEFFLVYALHIVHLEPPRRPPQSSVRESDSRALRTDSGVFRDLRVFNDIHEAGLQDYATSLGRQ
ncbi:hypothetical protein J6590_089989 [Homalodisca vitripennis]|nr:hypothetical protein J6590_089989 [Homalodisca vitripennis]